MRQALGVSYETEVEDSFQNALVAQKLISQDQLEIALWKRKEHTKPLSVL